MMSAANPSISGAWWRVKVSPARQALGVLLLVLAGLFFYAMATKGLRFFVVESISMEPTLRGGDRIIAIKPDEFTRGDIVIVRDPLEKGYLVKRVVGLPGDVIQVRAGALFVNGQYVSEPYRPEPILYVLNEYVVPKGEVFVLGDNANRSVDSHNWAAGDKDSHAIVPDALATSAVVGRAIYQYYPFGRMGPVRHFPFLIDDATALSRSAVVGPVQ